MKNLTKLKKGKCPKTFQSNIFEGKCPNRKCTINFSMHFEFLRSVVIPVKCVIICESYISSATCQTKQHCCLFRKRSISRLRACQHLSVLPTWLKSKLPAQQHPTLLPAPHGIIICFGVCVCHVRYGISKKTTLNLIAVVVECSRAINFSSSFMNKNAVALLTLGKYVFGVTCQFTFNSNNLALIHNKNHMKGIFLYHHEGHFPSKIS